jgi:hypothetical protein
VTTFLAADRGRWLWMSALLAAAAVTRLPGVLLVVPLAVLIWHREGVPRTTLRYLLTGPAALLGFAAYQGAALGSPVAFITAQSSWNFPSRSSGPGGVDSLPIDPVVPLLTCVLLYHVFLFVYMRSDRLPRSYIVMSVIGVLTILASLRLLSAPRYLAVVWPFHWTLARRPALWFQQVWPIASTGLFVLFAVLHFTGSLAP